MYVRFIILLTLMLASPALAANLSGNYRGTVSNTRYNTNIPLDTRVNTLPIDVSVFDNGTRGYVLDNSTGGELEQAHVNNNRTSGSISYRDGTCTIQLTIEFDQPGATSIRYTGTSIGTCTNGWNWDKRYRGTINKY